MITEVVPYLNFSGQASEALELYKVALGAAENGVMRYRDMPGGDFPEGSEDLIMHGCIRIGAQDLNLCDMPCSMEVTTGNHAHVMLQFDDPQQLEACFTALAEGGEVKMPVHDTFWGARYGQLVDRFGVSWMFNCQLGG